jgi:O-antigen/teichoic acid export membrane protein
VLGRRSFILYISKMLTAALAYIGLKFISIYLDKDVYGTVVAAMALVATFNAVADLGFSSAHVKRISEGCDPNECISTFAFIKIVLTSFMVVLTLSSIFIWTSVLGNTISGTSMDVIYIFILYQVLYDISGIATATFQAKMEMAKLPLVTMIDPIIRVPLVIFICLNSMGVLELSFTYLFGAIAVLIASLYLIFREKIKWTRPTLLRSYYTFALPLLLITIISTVSGSADKLLITFFWNKDDVALYAAPAVFLGVFATMSTAISTLTFPSFSKLHKEGNLREIRELTKGAERYIVMFGLPITILILMYPFNISEILLDQKYRESGKAIGIMVVTTFITMINAVHASQIVAVGRPDISARITIITVLINIGLMLAFIPAYGFGLSFVGAAIALLIGNIIGFFIVRFAVYRLTGTCPDKRLVLHLLAGLLSATALYVLGMVLPFDGWIPLAVYGTLAFASYLGALVLLKEFTRKDLDFLLDIMNIRKMLVYIKEELSNN